MMQTFLLNVQNYNRVSDLNSPFIDVIFIKPIFAIYRFDAMFDTESGLPEKV